MKPAVYIPKGRYWSSRLSTLPLIPLTRTTQHLQLDRHIVHPRNVIKFTTPPGPSDVSTPNTAVDQVGSATPRR